MATAVLDHFPAPRQGIIASKGGAIDFVRLFALDRLPLGRQRLVCHWRCDVDGRLVCIWEPDITLPPQL